MRALWLPLWMMAGCGQKATCVDFAEALDACAAEAYDEPQPSTIEACERDQAQDTPAEQYDCGIEALEGGDCSSIEGYAEALTAVLDCDEES